MKLFENTVLLRGFLGKDAEVPDAGIVTAQSYAVLALCIGSGTWRKLTNEWKTRTDWHWIICPGPFFCGFTRGMKQGDYVEVEGELRGGTSGSAVYALQVRKLEPPPMGVEDGDG